MKKLSMKGITMRKLTYWVMLVGAIIGALFGGSYNGTHGFFGVLLGVIFWGAISAFGFKGLFEFAITLVSNTKEADEASEDYVFEPEVVIDDDTEEEGEDTSDDGK